MLCGKFLISVASSEYQSLWCRCEILLMGDRQWFNELLSTDPWFKDVVPNFRVLDKKEIPNGADTGTAFTSVCINVSHVPKSSISQTSK